MINYKSVLILFLALSACSGNYYQIPTPEMNSKEYVDLGQASETATGVMLFNFIPIQQNNKLQRAIDSAIASKGGDSMTNIQVRERWYWAYVLNLYKTDVTGTVVKKK